MILFITTKMFWNILLSVCYKHPIQREEMHVSLWKFIPLKAHSHRAKAKANFFFDHFDCSFYLFRLFCCFHLVWIEAFAHRERHLKLLWSNSLLCCLQCIYSTCSISRPCIPQVLLTSCSDMAPHPVSPCRKNIQFWLVYIKFEVWMVVYDIYF